MTWSTPSTRTTGDMITAAIWNQDNVDNPIALFTWRTRSLWIPATLNSNGGTTDRIAEGSQGGILINANDEDGTSTFVAPSDFGTLVSMLAYLTGGTTNTLNYDIRSFYAAAGEAYNMHTGSSLGQTLAITANQVFSIDVSSLYTSLAAGDVASFSIENNGAIGAYFHGLLMRYNPS